MGSLPVHPARSCLLPLQRGTGVVGAGGVMMTQTSTGWISAKCGATARGKLPALADGNRQKLPIRHRAQRACITPDMNMDQKSEGTEHSQNACSLCRRT